jgi:2-oxoglutarate dehydrogenase E1 component
MWWQSRNPLPMSATLPARPNLDLLESYYAAWKADTQSVDAHWQAFFEGFELGLTRLVPAAAGKSSGGALSEEELGFRMKVTDAVMRYRSLGHTGAWLDPLSKAAPQSAVLTLSALGFSENDLGTGVATQFFRQGQRMALGAMLDELRRIYCDRIGFEFMHIHKPEVRAWLQERIEARGDLTTVPGAEQINALRWLLEVEMFENFLHTKFIGQKRFSLEGGDALMVSLETLLQEMPQRGGAEIVMGMAHRGRLSVLANFLRKPLEMLFYEFSDNYVPNMVAGDGDVKYHLGFETDRQLPGDQKVRVELAANPSHLEAVNPVVEGKARARQRHLNDTTERKKVIPVLVHGDAAFAGQGLVAEVLNLSQLPGYRTGGTIHLVVNNQIGFTTSPEDARSSDYCTDVAKMIDAPVFHVNGDCPLEVAWVTKLALDFRQTFSRDVIIDIVCYRRYGHNETDEPSFTQPNMARAIRDHATPATVFAKELIARGVISADDAAALRQQLSDRLEASKAALEQAGKEKGDNPYEGSMPEIQAQYDYAPVPTGVEAERLTKLGHQLLTTPEGFRLHSTIEKRFLAARRKSVDTGEGFDWAHAEALAFASLLTDGQGVRLSGQDCRRGTFSQRHCVLYDTETRERHFPLKNLSPDQGLFCVYNSLLSEAAVLGFDYGYSLLAPEVLICWEAQFGDFANGAQVIIDQFLASAESKWQQPSSLVMLLPHGYEGQGPEHSSARLERFLQLSAGGNWQVCNLTTPAQYFHALRRQLKRKTRKPLILMTPKSLLRHPRAVSKVADMGADTTFREFLDDELLATDPARVTRIIFCSGKVYYDLIEHREKEGIKNAAIIRVEQLYPLHHVMLKGILTRYTNPNIKWVWCQEEPKNMGAYSNIAPRMEEVYGQTMRYAGRERGSSPSTGSKAVHYAEQHKLVADAFEV